MKKGPIPTPNRIPTLFAYWCWTSFWCACV